MDLSKIQHLFLDENIVRNKVQLEIIYSDGSGAY